MRIAIISVVLAACGTTEPEHVPAPVPAAPVPAPAPPPAPAAEPDLTTMTPEQQKVELMKIGENVYKAGGKGGIACMTCHMENGQGTPGSFPPLVDTKAWMGDCTHHAGIVVHGLSGEIEVKGQKYNGVMTPQGTMLTDLEIAAVTTYERHSWGNDFGICLPADVAAARTAPPPTGPQGGGGGEGKAGKGGKAGKAGKAE